ncbi:MAG: helix-turn-helix domain-containing protein, partial [Delftia sp.]|nr:helix-turn-helix domain-containing protein [Delftia sp.]
LGAVSLLAGDHSADERMAAFLIDLSVRYAARGFSATRFHLSMSRGDIANYLRLAAETVSRVLSRFRAQKLIEIDGRELALLDLDSLRKLGASLLPDQAG